MNGQARCAGNAPLLDVRDLHVGFDTAEGHVRAVDGVSLAVHAGEALGIVGESGSGKSVTALALMGLLPVPPARVRAERIRLGATDLLGLDSDGMVSVRGRRVGFVFQDPLAALNPVMRVGRQIGEVIEFHGGASRKDAERAAIDWLAHVGIPAPAEISSAYPHQLSGGMRQRAMIAMALAGEPELLIADEPTTALDVTVQAQIVALIRQLCDELGMALIWISHDFGVVAGIADRVAVMRSGRVVETAPAGQLYASPREPYTRELVALARSNAVGVAGRA
ncbi:MAG: ABC transporter ATP-binding protein [Gammaproteobacteria bacterium]|nr:ABC transporter ATP-binding protein [Gammaproteobacteria bacterium]MDE0366563.1 ABC transporter ATP-binding protein [Gammaproteobacteria bacterium]